MNTITHTHPRQAKRSNAGPPTSAWRCAEMNLTPTQARQRLAYAISAGDQLLATLAADDGEMSRTAQASILARLDHLEAQAERYRAVLVGRCRICGALLSDPVSVARCVGPECWKQVGGGQS